jgi:MFS family permease
VTEQKPGFIATVKSYPSAFWVANTMEIFERMAWYGFYAVSSLYITGPVETGGLGFTSEERGQLQAIVPFFLYLFPVLTGALADRYGYKRMFIIAYVGMIISYFALGQFKTFPTFLAAFMMVAVAAAIFKPVVVGTVARVTNEGNSAMAFGIFYMMVNIGGLSVRSSPVWSAVSHGNTCSSPAPDGLRSTCSSRCCFIVSPQRNPRPRSAGRCAQC